MLSQCVGGRMISMLAVRRKQLMLSSEMVGTLGQAHTNTLLRQGYTEKMQTHTHTKTFE